LTAATKITVAGPRIELLLNSIERTVAKKNIINRNIYNNKRNTKLRKHKTKEKKIKKYAICETN